RSPVAGVELPREENRGPAHDLQVLGQPPVLGLEARDLGALLGADAGTCSGVDVGLHSPPPDRFLAQSQPAADLVAAGRQRRVLSALLGYHPHRPLLDRGIDFLRHTAILLDSKRMRRKTWGGSKGSGTGVVGGMPLRAGEGSWVGGNKGGGPRPGGRDHVLGCP